MSKRGESAVGDGANRVVGADSGVDHAEAAVTPPVIVSIIIPVYRVERYLDACVRSVVGQTHWALEIILVDDGSPDNCPALCDAWEVKDSRVKVVHKPNGGLADARNAGVALATGDYIAFVDSDDVVSHQAIEYMVDLAEKHAADIVATAFVKFVDAQAPVFDIGGSVFTGASEAVLQRLVSARINWSAWGKLFRREVIPSLPFVKGRLYEDVDFTPRVFRRASTAVLSDAVTYGYRQRADSIMGALEAEISADLLFGLQDAIDEVGAWLGDHTAEFDQLFASYLLHGAKKLEYSSPTAGVRVSDEFVDAFPSFVRRNWSLVRRSKSLSSLYKVGLAVASVSPSTFIVLVRWGRRVKPVFGRLLLRRK